jgi:aryl-alcohol dehydrogenase-like predicted oxidoreductase
MYMIHWPRPQEYEVTSTITGPRAPSEIEDTIKAAEWELTKEDITAMDRLLKRRQESLSSK